jgi:hypothetical protein
MKSYSLICICIILLKNLRIERHVQIFRSFAYRWMTTSSNEFNFTSNFLNVFYSLVDLLKVVLALLLFSLGWCPIFIVEKGTKPRKCS